MVSTPEATSFTRSYVLDEVEGGGNQTDGARAVF